MFKNAERLGLSPEELFDLLVFMERKGVISIA